MMSLRFSTTIISLIIFCLFTSGCASINKQLKAWLGGKDPDEQIRVTTPRFSEQENLKVSSDRQYRRMNRQRFEEEADVKEDAGSLWVMEGQGAYLFAQNQMRMVGDLLNVKIEGGPKTQLQTKVRVISKLLERLENPGRGLASVSPGQNGASPQTPPAAAAPAPGAPPAVGPDGQPAPAADAAATAKADGPFNVQSVPTRIVEQLKDGSYRVRGMQPFMIGKREYKVIVTGVVRPEDFDEGGLDSSKLLDSQFDIVSSRKGATL